MPLVFTPLMQKRLTAQAHGMLTRALEHFPELQDKTITVGYTRAHLGSASLSYRPGREPRLIIRLKIRKLTYQTIGHELTHLLQGLGRGDRRAHDAVAPDKIPAGEKQCDIWTLARHEMFCDDAPTYLRLPRVMRERWLDYAGDVRGLCTAAIDKRNTHRLYIRWLEAEIPKLVKTPPQEKNEPQQLTLQILG